MAKIIRATVYESGVGKNRYQVMKDCISRYYDAMAHNYFLEAVALVESLIADRLESRLTEINNKPHHFDTLGHLRNDLSSIETSKEIKKIINKGVNKWVENRNISIHQSAKIEQGKRKELKEHLKFAKDTASGGFKIFKELNKELSKLRRSAKKKTTIKK